MKFSDLAKTYQKARFELMQRIVPFWEVIKEGSEVPKPAKAYSSPDLVEVSDDGIVRVSVRYWWIGEPRDEWYEFTFDVAALDLSLDDFREVVANKNAVIKTQRQEAEKKKRLLEETEERALLSRLRRKYPD